MFDPNADARAMQNEPTRIYVKNLRKDGKYTCTYVFPISGRRIGAILTPEKLEAERAAGYLVVGR